MKLILSNLILLSLLISTACFAQNFDPADIDPELEDALSAEEALAQNPDTEEIEREEDVLHPEGETSDWSLGSEDLPAEGYE
jgi:hypothetical protein